MFRPKYFSLPNTLTKIFFAKKVSIDRQNCYDKLNYAGSIVYLSCLVEIWNVFDFAPHIGYWTSSWKLPYRNALLVDL